MILDLESYQVDSVYPMPKNIRPDKQLATTLKEGYSGESSELTTVLQYAYHSLQCKSKYNKLSEVIRGIFYVETLHMELLGECIFKLGGDTAYDLRLREKSISWQASLVHYESSPSKILLANIQGEKGAVSFYETTAATINQPDISNLLLRLAEDEKLHVRIFTDLYHQHFR